MAKNKVKEKKYDPQYPTCKETYGTLCIFSDKLTPKEITKILGIKPTEFFVKGDIITRRVKTIYRKSHGWFLDTAKLKVKSKDCRQHLDWILKQLKGRESKLKALHKLCEMNICFYWESIGQGGPWLMPYQMEKLAKLNLEIWYDVYFGN